MPYQTKFVSGQYNMECQICTATFKNVVMRKNWKGFWSCPRCWEPRPEFLFSKQPKWDDPKPVKDVQGPEAVDLEE